MSALFNVPAPRPAVPGAPGPVSEQISIPLPVVPSQTGPRSDVQRALDMCSALCVDTDRMWFTVLPGDPPSKARPRFSRRGRSYTDPKDRASELITKARLRQLIPQPLTGNVALGCVFFRPNRQRIDADNMLKHVCDAANGVLFLDDSQVTAILGLVELDAENPRTIVVVGEHVTTMTRGTDATKPCEQCGNPISLIGRKKPRRFCGVACKSAAQGPGRDEPVPCEQCRMPFRRATRAQKLCSPACRADYLRAKRREKAKPRSRCSTCGKELAHTRGGRCRDCWRLGGDT